MENSTNLFYVLTGLDGAGVFSAWDALTESMNYAAKVSIKEFSNIEEARTYAFNHMKKVEPLLKENYFFPMNFYRHKCKITNKDKYD